MVIAKRPGDQESKTLWRHLGAGLTNEVLLEMYRTMLLARAVDDRGWLLTRQGKAAFMISGHGHEACQVASAYALRRGYDNFFPHYRDTAVFHGPRWSNHAAHRPRRTGYPVQRADGGVLPPEHRKNSRSPAGIGGLLSHGVFTKKRLFCSPCGACGFD